MMVTHNALEKLNAQINEPLIIFVKGLQFRARIVHTIKHMPVERYMREQNSELLIGGSECLVSQEQFSYMMRMIWKYHNLDADFIRNYWNQLPQNTSHGIPQGKLVIKFKRPLSAEERNQLSAGLKFYTSAETIQMFDVATLLGGVEEGAHAIMIFYYIVSAIVITLAYFLLQVIFKSNIKENALEIKILRCLGITHGQTKQIYSYEALFIIAASSLLGSVVGITICEIITISIVTLMEMPVETSNVNFFTCILLFFAGMISAYQGSSTAVAKLRKIQISEIDKL